MGKLIKIKTGYSISIPLKIIKTQTFGLLVNDEIVAKTIVFYNGERALKNKRIYLMCFGVSKEYRNLGYGTEFLNLLIEYFHPLDVSLGVEPHNEIAYKLYNKCGLHTIEYNCYDSKCDITYNLLST